MKKIIARLASTALAATFLFSQNIALAHELSSPEYQKIRTSSCELEVLGEVVEDRDEYTKHLQLSDLSRIAVVYSDQVHYKDKNGTFKEIDNSLTETGESFENFDSPLKVKLSKHFGDKKLVTVSSNGQELSWNYINPKKAEKTESEEKADEPVQIENFKSKSKKHANKKDELTDVSNCHSIAKYKNIDSDIDFEYELSGLSFKENIILNKKLDNIDSFDFEFKTNGLKIKKEKNGSLLFVDEKGKTVFVMPKSFMHDFANNYSNDVDYNFEEVNGGYIISVVPDKKWLETAVYPVKIDPPLDLPPVTNEDDDGSIEDAQVYEGDKAQNYKNVNHFSVGRGNPTAGKEWVSYIKCPGLPLLRNGAIVTDAQLKLMPIGNNPSWGLEENEDKLIIAAKSMNIEWDRESITWNSERDVNPDVQDFFEVTNAKLNSWHEWNVTRVVKEWYNSRWSNAGFKNENNGIELSVLDATSNDIGIKYTSAESHGDSPRFEIYYRNFIGEEPYWSYTSGGVGRINNYAGTLSVSENVLSNAGARNPLSISNTYNNSNYNLFPNSITYKENGPVNGFSRSSFTGHGWTFNFNQIVRIIPEIDELTGETDKLYAANWRYNYIDSDGTWHFFKTTNANDPNAICEDEDGLGLKLQVTNDVLEIWNKSDYKLTFEKIGSDNCFVLDFEEDSDENKIKYERDPNLEHKVTRIMEVQGEDNNVEFGRETEIEYINGKVSKIKNPDNTEINFAYNGDKLIEVIYPDGLKTGYIYDSYGRLSRVWTNAGTGSSVSYEYASNHYMNTNFFKVKNVTEYGSQNIDPKARGNSIHFDYEMNQTKITHKTDNLDVPYHESTETWQFDHEGRVTCVMDENDNMVTAKYMEPANNKEKHKIRHANDTGKYTNNLLKNPDAESNTDHWKYGFINRGNLDATNPRENTLAALEGNSLTTTENEHYLGEKCFSLSQTSDQPLWIVGEQRVKIPDAKHDRKYTFSGYIKTTKFLENGEGAGLQLAAFKGKTQVASDTYTEWTRDTESEWIRQNTTITAPAGTTEIICYMGIKESKGTAFFDCLQLEEGEFLTDYNMVKNSSFDCGFDHWIKHGLDENIDIIKDEELKIVGNHTQEKSVSQNIKINREKAVLAVRACARGVAVHQTKENQKYFISCKLIYEDDFEYTEKFNFNPNVSDDQCIYGSIVADEHNPGVKLREIQIAPSFNNNCNTVYFDNIQVCYDDFGVIYDRDPNGNVKGTTDNTGEHTHTPRNANNEITEIKGTNYHIEPKYDEKNGRPHRLKSSKSLIGENQKVKTKFRYDSFGNVINSKLQDEAGTEKFIKTESEYTNSGNFPLWSKDSRGYQTDFEYNEENGNLDKITAPNQVATSYEYDSVGRVKSATSKDQSANVLSQIAYSYANGALSSITNSMGMAYNFVRNAFGKITQTKIGNQEMLTKNYDKGNGLLKQVKYNNNQHVRYDYDKLGRLIKRHNYNHRNHRNGGFDYTYDHKNRLVKTHDEENNFTTKIDYDMYGRLDKIRRSDGAQRDFYFTKNSLIDHETFKYKNINQTRHNAYLPGNRLKASTVTTNGVDFCSDYWNLDHLGRPVHLAMSSSKNANGGLIKHWKYEDVGNDKTTTLVKDLSYNLRQSGNYSNTPDLKFSYDYDNMGNITDVEDKDDNLIVHYEYDKLNQLKRENNVATGETVIYSYDLGGNISKKEFYSYNDGTSPLQLQREVNYAYSDNDWKDKLTSYDGQEIIYDGIGNPVQYRDGWTFEWARGRKVDKMLNSCYNIECKYDDAGIRTQKTVTENGVTKTTDFITNGIQILAQKIDDDTIVYQIDGNGSVLGFMYNEDMYYYLKNAQNDVVGVVNSAGEIVASYTYDSWGKLVSIKSKDEQDQEIDVTNDRRHIGNINPLRYRGYYYDVETGLYYLNARYYDPETGRFISMDDNLIGGLNLFNYCYNNPVNLGDWTGCIPTAMEAANMAEHIYGEVGDDTLTGKWVKEKELTGGFGLVMGVYSRTVDNKKEYALVSKGTSEWQNWVDNLLQQVNASPDAWKSIFDAKKFVDDNPDNEVTMVGHSKGGAEAQLNAFVTNKNCITFNSASVSLGAKILGFFTYSAKATTYIVKGEVLNLVSPLLGSQGSNKIYLSSKYTKWNPLNVTKNHSMEAVKWGLANAGYN